MGLNATEVLRKVESMLDRQPIVVNTLRPYRKLGSLFDPNGCLSQFADDQSYKGYWDVVCDRIYEDDSPWLVQRVAGNRCRYQFADTLAEVQSFFSKNGEDVIVRRTEREAHNPDLWWIRSNDSPEERGIAFDYKVYATVFDADGAINTRAIKYHLGRKERYTNKAQRKWEIVFMWGEFWLRKCCDHDAKFVLKIEDDPVVKMPDIRKILFPNPVTVTQSDMVDGGHSFFIRITLPTGGKPVNIGRWCIENDKWRFDTPRELNPFGHFTYDRWKDRAMRWFGR